MPRRPRIFNSDLLYHITSRGVRRHDIVRTDDDRRYFVELLANVVADRHWTLHAWVLMTNHFHLVVTAPEQNLSDGMHDLLGDYARRFNSICGFVGYVFQRRFDAKPVERETHLLELIRYLPLNPVRAGLVRSPADWPWSSYRATAGFDPAPPWLEVNWTLAQFDPTDRTRAQILFREFVCAVRDVEYNPHDDRTRRDVPLDVILKIVQDVTGAAESDFSRPLHGPLRKLVAGVAADDCGATLKAIGQRLGTSTAAVFKLRERHRQLLTADRVYALAAARIREKLNSRPGP